MNPPRGPEIQMGGPEIRSRARFPRADARGRRRRRRCDGESQRHWKTQKLVVENEKVGEGMVGN